MIAYWGLGYAPTVQPFKPTSHLLRREGTVLAFGRKNRYKARVSFSLFRQANHVDKTCATLDWPDFVSGAACSSISGFSCWCLAGAILAGALAGCGRNDIQDYRVAKETPAAQSAKLPAGWEQVAPGQMR